MAAPKLSPGNIRLLSSSTPGLSQGSKYQITFQQEIASPAPNSVSETLESVKDFSIRSQRFNLDKSAIHSVYPPSGHSDYASGSLFNV